MNAAPVSVETVIGAAAQLAGVDRRALRDTRSLVIDPWRRRAMFVSRRLRPNLSYPTLGQLFHRHHTTVLAAVRAVSDRLAAGDNAEHAAVADLLSLLGYSYLPGDRALARARLVTVLARAEREVADLRAAIDAIDAAGATA